METKEIIFLIIAGILGLIGAYIGYLIGCKILEQTTLIQTKDLANAYLVIPLVGFVIGASIPIGIHQITER